LCGDGRGLSLDQSRWISVRRRRHRRPFLFPVKAMSQVFRGKYLAALARLHRRGTLRFAGQCAHLTDCAPWERLLSTLRHTKWVVYAKRPFGGPATVLKYLSRYTHRVAISNHRLRFVGDGSVRFLWKDYTDHTAHKELTLPAAEFLRRFLLHVVPRGFMRIRHYGSWPIATESPSWRAAVNSSALRQGHLLKSRSRYPMPPATAKHSTTPPPRHRGRPVRSAGHRCASSNSSPHTT